MTTEESAEQTSEAFLDGWDDATEDGATETGETTLEQTGEVEEAQAEEPAAEETETEAETEAEAEHTEAPAEEPAQQPQEDVPKTWQLQHLGDTKTVDEQEMTALAQKGLDYDRIRGKYDESKPVMELFGQFAKRANMDIPGYLTFLRTQAKQAEGLDEAEARRAVDLEDREAAIAAKEAEEAERTAEQEAATQRQTQADARRQADILEFQKTFPDAARDPQSIPKEVWDGVTNGLSLVASYAKWQVSAATAQAQAAKEQAAAAVQNQRNADRSTGSMKSAGEERKAKDIFADAFGD